MTKIRFSSIIAILTLSVFFTSCDDTININADYSVTPVIFGILDHGDSIHYIKITKTFLGDGDNNEFAKIPDSSYFRQVDAKIIELKDEVETGRQWILKDSTVLTKEDGVFYNPSQKVFVFYEKELKEDHQYKLEAILNEGEYTVDATTSLIDGFKYDNFFLSTESLTFAASNGNNLSFPIRYKEGRNATSYQTKIVINYSETYINNTTEIKSIVWSAAANNGFGDGEINPDNPTNRSITFRGQDFYNFVSAQLNVDENVTNRKLIDVDIITEIGHEDLMKYIEVSQPSSGLAQTTPLFTNVNGGLGLFSSRHIASRLGMGLTSGSIEVLCTREPTNIYKFCSTLPVHSSKFFYCN
ncbi:MAG: DUF4249 family protein [Crocinitomicaceae bacterium]